MRQALGAVDKQHADLVQQADTVNILPGSNHSEAVTSSGRGYIETARGRRFNAKHS